VQHHPEEPKGLGPIDFLAEGGNRLGAQGGGGRRDIDKV
jgi:hypothetical protein